MQQKEKSERVQAREGLDALLLVLRLERNLSQKSQLFINSVGSSTINTLLDDLLEDGVIHLEEIYKVRDENATVTDKAQVLTDLVIGKRCHAFGKFIQHLCQEDPEIALKMGLK
ncbi:caspase recruitment domain-containing protein 18-like [Choloepus didactylus]|uniref:caspase recruitment domain-containing protein 18-like n=1 Tax=Choloepus didactylus TaxID=27675 RepID=UPI00189E03B6|nr:caspase recruitment domain-containing protein 18-like [Choloepus didactylus]